MCSILGVILVAGSREEHIARRYRKGKQTRLLKMCISCMLNLSDRIRIFEHSGQLRKSERCICKDDNRHISSLWLTTITQ
jgi:hypothetical protein